MSEAIAPSGVALIGSGNIARRYVRGMARYPELALVGVFDRHPDRAIGLAREVGAEAFPTLDAALGDERVQIVVNITPPRSHPDVTLAALTAGKHVYVEKPIATAPGLAQEGIDEARRRGLVLGAAPDTFLGSAHQTARKAIDEGMLGDVIAAAVSIPHTHIERWHPSPAAFFQAGGGPVLDMGPYYVTSLAALFGPVRNVAGMTRIGATPRVLTAPERVVDRVDATTTTHAGALLRFASGVIVSTQMSFDVWNTDAPRIEVYGSRGTLQIPDPNHYDGDVRFRGIDDDAWVTLAPIIPTFGAPGSDEQYLRGPGVADLARSLGGKPLRVGAELAMHVLEVLLAIETSSSTEEFVSIESSCERPVAAY
jgi:predicted dehydrogenase